MLLAALGSVAAATERAPTPYLGAEWRPLSRGDLTWVVEGQTSGLSVGGLDGFVRPQLGIYGGVWATEHVGAQVSLGVARLRTVSWEGEVYEIRAWGVIRPGIDFRVSLLKRSDPRPIPWVFMGGHVDLPSAADQSNGFTAEEFELAQETEDLDRQKLGAIGGRVGIGADLEVVRHLRLGMSWAIDVQQSLRAENDPASANTWVSAEGALLLEIHWPPRGDEPDQAPISSDRSDASIPQAE